MPTPAHCPECGKELPASAPHGLCAACLLKRGLETNTGGYTAENPSRWQPPAVEQLSERFPELEILRLIGRGGMGAVYLARQKNLDRMIALKILPPEIGRDPVTGSAFAERFAREAQALARLNHPHIVAIYEFGQRDGLYFLLMEFVDGMNLRGLLDAGHIAPKEALAIVPQICEALQFAHDHGIVHRDIKPENILLSKTGQVKIADFGLAKLIGRPSSSPPSPPLATDPWPLTTAAGTPQYMAPEQTDRPAEVDHRADIYSLGVVFYQMLTGQLPPNPLTPPSTKVQIDVRLDEIVLKALERQPEKRYQQVSEVKTQVETIITTPQNPPSPRGGYNVSPPPPNIPNPQPQIPLPLLLFTLAFHILLAMVFLSVLVYFAPHIDDYFKNFHTSLPAAAKFILVLSRIFVIIGCFFIPFLLVLNTAVILILYFRNNRSFFRLYSLAVILILGAATVFSVIALVLPLQTMITAGTIDAERYPDYYRTLITLCIVLCLPIAAYFFWRRFSAAIDRTRSVSEGQSPVPQAKPASLDQARQTLHIPAIGLRFAAVINLLPLLLLAIFYTVARITEIPAPEPHAHTSISGPAILVVLIDALFALYILRGASDMLRLRRYPRTIAASILALLAFPGNLLGLPFGIWSLILLSRREIKDTFAANTHPGAPHGNAGAVPAPPANQNATLSIIALILSLLGFLAELSLSLYPLPNIFPAYAALIVFLSVAAFITLIAALFLGFIAHRRWPARIAIILSLTAILWPLLHLRTIRIPVPISPSSAATRPAPVRTALVRTGDLPIYLTAAGSIVSSNKAPAPVVTRPNRNPFMVFFTLPEGDQTTSVIKQTLAGQHLPVDVFDRYFQKKIAEGSLDDIDNQFDTATATLGCRAHATPLEDQLLLPGQNVNVRLLLDTLKNVTLVPQAAIQQTPSGDYAWVVKPGKTDQEIIVERRNITTGETNGGTTEIISGLTPGETVVTDGVDNLHNGDKVRPFQSHIPATQSAPASSFTTPSFSLVIERMLPFTIPCRQHLLQFHNGKIYQVGHGPDTTQEEYDRDWKQVEQEGGVDVSVLPLENGLQISGRGCIFTNDVNKLSWDTTTAADAMRMIANASFSYGVVEPAKKDFPVTYLFKTAAGETGIVQILAIIEDERGSGTQGVKIRFKLVQQPITGTTASQTRTNIQTSATNPSISFGPVIERVVNDPDATSKDCFIDLNTGKLVSIPDDSDLKARIKAHLLTMIDKEIRSWESGKNVDATSTVVIENGKVVQCGLKAVHLMTARVANEAWEKWTPGQVENDPDLDPSSWRWIPEIAELNTNGAFPTTWIFRTDEGGVGILQITGFTENPRGVKIRYKLAQQSPIPTPSIEN